MRWELQRIGAQAFHQAGCLHLVHAQFAQDHRRHKAGSAAMLMSLAVLSQFLRPEPKTLIFFVLITS